MSNTFVKDFTLESDFVKVKLNNGNELIANNLIGADGINSLVRTKLNRINGEKTVQPHHCGYAYFRAVVDLSN